MRTALLTVAISVSIAGNPLQQPVDSAIKNFTMRIPAASRRTVARASYNQNWRNPVVTIRAEGIEIQSKAIAGSSKTVSPDDLGGLLMGLPASAWPYGRVVVASDIGLRRADCSDEPAITRNHRTAAELLARLSVQVVWVPSA
jgi:hypothetical protein